MYNYSDDEKTLLEIEVKKQADEIKMLREHCDRMASLAIDNARDVLKQANEIERLREALHETLEIAKRNEVGDYIQRAESALKEKE